MRCCYIAQVASELGDKIKVLKIDTDENPELSTQLQVRQHMAQPVHGGQNFNLAGQFVNETDMPVRLTAIRPTADTRATNYGVHWYGPQQTCPAD